ncbi:hypothetical protein B0A48_00664 [Cryoendolithus antarcticus]|uniref:Uncharacterized protein n=1 Tax=Cryoendolithus antarcticus TaxID=1507870 RepID=A0A1V8TVH7_9PEZI|nr:hypothetical protein B0A48_00664 [Cryoendolithus antarcticus]
MVRALEAFSKIKCPGTVTFAWHAIKNTGEDPVTKGQAERLQDQFATLLETLDAKCVKTCPFWGTT